MLNAPDGTPQTMGSSLTFTGTPRFKVTAKGSFKQAEGCPSWVPAERAAESCHDSCYNPTGERYRLQQVDVVRIRPQITGDEELAELIDDPFLTLDCPNEVSCEVEFEDPEYASSERPALYYVRVLQEPTGQLNHDDLRCETDAEGNCLSVDICPGGIRGEDDDCIQPGSERAWASPIYLFPEGSTR